MVILNETHSDNKDVVVPVVIDQQTNRGILCSLSPQLWAHVLHQIPLPKILQINCVSKEIRESVENDIVWSNLFLRDFPQVRINPLDSSQNWGTNYKKYYKKLFRPLSINISMSRTKMQFGDTVQMTINFTNCSDKPLHLIVGNITNDFLTGKVLRTKVGGKSRNNNKCVIVYPKILRRQEEQLYEEKDKSRVITVEDDYTLTISARLELHQGNLGLKITEFSGIFLPLVESQNKVWIYFTSDGKYINQRNPFDPGFDTPFWQGTVYSNKISVYINQSDPATLPIRVKDYEKKSNEWLSRRLSQF